MTKTKDNRNEFLQWVTLFMMLTMLGIQNASGSSTNTALSTTSVTSYLSPYTTDVTTGTNPSTTSDNNSTTPSTTSGNTSTNPSTTSGNTSNNPSTTSDNTSNNPSTTSDNTGKIQSTTSNNNSTTTPTTSVMTDTTPHTTSVSTEIAPSACATFVASTSNSGQLPIRLTIIIDIEVNHSLTENSTKENWTSLAREAICDNLKPVAIVDVIVKNNSVGSLVIGAEIVVADDDNISTLVVALLKLTEVGMQIGDQNGSVILQLEGQTVNNSWSACDVFALIKPGEDCPLQQELPMGSSAPQHIDSSDDNMALAIGLGVGLPLTFVTTAVIAYIVYSKKCFQKKNANVRPLLEEPTDSRSSGTSNQGKSRNKQSPTPNKVIEDKSKDKQNSVSRNEIEDLP